MLPNRKIAHDTFPLRAFKAKYLGSTQVNNRPDVPLDGSVVTGFSIYFFQNANSISRKL